MQEGLPRFAYFPFGGGPRICIGEAFAWTEGILVLATLAQRWRFQTVPGHPIALRPLITLRPRYGLRVTVGSHERAETAKSETLV
jgi:cytochrome P450